MKLMTHCLLFVVFAALSAVTLAEESSGEPEALFEQARSHLTGGGGVRRDPDKAFELMKQAADAGHAPAIGGLGYFYSKGLVVEKDEKQAAEWFRKGADAGSASAMLNYGTVLMQGRGVEASLDEGVEWIRKAADADSPDACLRWGNILYFGEHGRDKNAEAAHPYLLKAAEAGNAVAQNNLGLMFETGEGVGKDYDQAIEWFRKAAEQDLAKAQFNLGRMLAPHNPGPRRVEAFKWLILARDAGEVAADKMLREFTDESFAGELAEARAMANTFKAENYKPAIFRR